MQHFALNEKLVERLSDIHSAESSLAVWIKSFIQLGMRRPPFTVALEKKRAKGKEVRGLDLIRVTLATLFLMKDKVFSFWANYKTNVVTSNFATSKYESCHAD